MFYKRENTSRRMVKSNRIEIEANRAVEMSEKLLKSHPIWRVKVTSARATSDQITHTMTRLVSVSDHETHPK